MLRDRSIQADVVEARRSIAIHIVYAAGNTVVSDDTLATASRVWARVACRARSGDRDRAKTARAPGAPRTRACSCTCVRAAAGSLQQSSHCRTCCLACAAARRVPVAHKHARDLSRGRVGVRPYELHSAKQFWIS